MLSNTYRPLIVHCVELLDGLHESNLQTVDDLLSRLLETGGAEPPRHGRVCGANHACDATSSSRDVVVYINLK